MKNKSIIWTIALSLLIINVNAADNKKYSDADTIEVNFGDKGKILIHVESKEDLDALKDYDINSMLEDIEVPIEEELDDSEKVILEDDEGTKYLKDSIEKMMNSENWK
jgi:hypothetical protein